MRPSNRSVRRGNVRPARALAWALAAALACGSCGKPVTEQTAATVNGERITYGDLASYEVSRHLSAPVPASQPSPQRQLQRLGLLRELIDQRLLLQRANAQGLVAADREVDAAMERHRLAYGTDEQFRDFLAGIGIEPDTLKTQLRHQLTVERLLNREASSRVRVSESEMRDYYEANLKAFSVPEQQLHLAQILVTDTPESPIPNLRNDDATDPESALRKIRRVREELEDGAEFEQLALNYSEDAIYAANGGDMGFIPQSALEKMDLRLRRALTALEPGEFSQVVETDGEYRILRLLGIEPAGQREFDDPSVQDSIREVLANRKDQLLRLAFYEIERSRAKSRNYLAEQVAARYGMRD